MAYPWQPAEAHAAATQFCVGRGYQAAGATRPLTLPAALIQEVSLFLVAHCLSTTGYATSAALRPHCGSLPGPAGPAFPPALPTLLAQARKHQRTKAAALCAQHLCRQSALLCTTQRWQLTLRQWWIL